MIHYFRTYFCTVRVASCLPTRRLSFCGYPSPNVHIITDNVDVPGRAERVGGLLCRAQELSGAVLWGRPFGRHGQTQDDDLNGALVLTSSRQKSINGDVKCYIHYSFSTSAFSCPSGLSRSTPR